MFNHLPRTAGAAVARILDTALAPVFDYPGPTEVARQRWLAHPVDLDLLAPGALLMGHYTAPGGRVHERYPSVFSSTRYRLITFLREPISWVESHLRYFGPAEMGYADIDDTLAGLAGTCQRTYEWPPLSARDALDGYWFVGLCQCTHDDCDELLRRLGHPPRRLPDTNRSDRSSHAGLSAARRRRYQSLAGDDLELFRRVRVPRGPGS